MSGITTELLLIGLLLLVNGALAMSEIAVVSARKARLRRQAELGNRGAAAALSLAEEPTRFLSTVQIGITLVGILAGAFGGATIASALSASLQSVPGLAPYANVIGLAIVVGAITFLSLIVGELVPKRIALNAPERIAAIVARPMQLLSRIAAPFVVILSLTTDAVLALLRVRPTPEAEVTEEEVRVLIAQGTEAGVFLPTERELLEGTFELGETQVRELMTPRPLIEWIDLEDPVDAQWARLGATPHQHVLLCRGELDAVEGVLAVRQLVSDLVDGTRPDLASRAHQPIFVPDNVSAFGMLEQFKRVRPHFALVVDEHGGIAGVITPTDILEALVGDLAPMPQEPRTGPVQRADGSWLLDGLMPLDAFDELFHVSEQRDPRAERIQTLGGLIMSQLGRVPSEGDSVTWHGIRVEVVDMDGRRVDKVLAIP